MSNKELATILTTIVSSKPEKAKKETKKAAIESFKKTTSELLQSGALESLSAALLDYEENLLENLTLDEPRKLTQEEVDLLAAEYHRSEKILNALQARKELLRQYVFSSLDEEFESVGVESDTPVSQMPGRLVSSDGVKFCREGGTRKKATIDSEGLKEAFKDNLDLLFDKVEIPASVSYTLSSEKLDQAIESGSISIEELRPFVKPGDWSSPRFVIRE